MADARQIILDTDIGTDVDDLMALALLLGRWLALPLLQLQIVVVFCALPTASSAYVLAARMGGNGPFVAFLISASTILSVLTLPVWLHLVS